MSSQNNTHKAHFHKGHFDKGAEDYETLTGGVTRRIAQSFLHHLPPLTPTSAILDGACGPGIVASLVLDLAREQGVSPPPRIVAADSAPGMIEQVARKKEADPTGWATVEPVVLDAQTLEGLADESFDGVVMNFALFALPDADRAAREMVRILKSGGVAIVSTWKESGVGAVLQRVVDAIHPVAGGGKILPIPEEWYTKEKVREVMIAGGFGESKVTVTEENTRWQNGTVQELVDALSGPFWSALWQDWTEEEKGRWKGEVLAQLSEEEKSTASVDMIAWICVAVKG
jgi:ubiquinone/menaquinone biosynthesis C-methylase UbiE